MSLSLRTFGLLTKSLSSGLVGRPLVVAAILAARATAVPPRPVLAQSATGTIEGVVVDPVGRRAAGRHGHDHATCHRRPRASVVSGNDGAVQRAAAARSASTRWPPSSPGFTPRKQSDVRLTVGQTLTLRIEMSLATVAESVLVRATTPIIETSRSQVSSTVGEVSVQNLPVNGRNFIDFALLTPGVTKDVRTGDISFAGQRGTLNSLVIDGADNNNTFFGQSLGRTGSGRAPYQFSQDAVREFQVNSNAYSAEFGRAGGAVINVVTKSGTNDPHGSAFWFVRDKSMNANNAINVLRGLPKAPYHFDQFGGTLGGPIRKDKHFFFFNYDGQRNNTPNTVFLNLPSNTPTDPATLAAIERLRPLAESWDQRFNQDVFLIKTRLAAHAGRIG